MNSIYTGSEYNVGLPVKLGTQHALIEVEPDVLLSFNRIISLYM